MSGVRPTPPMVRALDKFTVADGCWLWVGAKNTSGYGHMAGEPGRHVAAHRLIYEAFRGPIPAGLHIDHLCRTPACVKPSHLEPVTNRENLLRGNTTAARLASKTHCLRGHEFTPENTRRASRGVAGRECRECSRIRHRALSATPSAMAKRRARYARMRDDDPERYARYMAYLREWRERRKERVA